MAGLLIKATGVDLYRELKIAMAPNRVFNGYILPEPGYVVISENNDMYLDMKEILRDGGPFRLFSKLIRGAVHSNGGAVTGPCFKSYMAQNHLTGADCLYIGDVDLEGVRIMNDAVDAIGVQPFSMLYMSMAALHARRRKQGLPLNSYGKAQKAKADVSRLIEGMPENPAKEIEWCIENRVRIPQEIVTKRDLENLIDNQAEL